MDPTGTISNGNAWVYVNIYGELLHVADNGTSLEPGLATSWPITNHGKTYTFHLRKNVRFSNGQKLKASDIVFCIKRGITSPNWGSLYPKFKSITAPNNSTVVVKLYSPWAPLLSDLGFFDVGVYPESYFKKVGASGLANHPLSTGPYELKSWNTTTNEVVLQKNPYYWDAKAYPMEYVDLIFTANDNTRLEALQAGTIDVDEGVPTSLVPVARGSSGIQVKFNRSTDIVVVTLNDKLPQFKDIKVREAIDHAIDRQQLVKSVLSGHGSPANSFIPKGALYWEPYSKLPVPSYNISEAKKLLGQSHYKKGFTMTFEIPGGSQEYSEIATILQSELAKIKIKLNLVTVDPGTLGGDQQSDDFHMLTTNWTNDIPDPDELTSFAVSKAGGAHDWFTWFDDKTLDRLTARGEADTNPTSRRGVYYQIQSRFNSLAPYYPLYYEPFANAVSTNVHGFNGQNPFGYFELMGVHKG